jgi:hypothetical protein
MRNSRESAAALSPPITRSATRILNSLLKTRRLLVDIMLPNETYSLFPCLTFGVHSTTFLRYLGMNTT